MDADAIPLQDPFLPFQNTTYDVQVGWGVQAADKMLDSFCFGHED